MEHSILLIASASVLCFGLDNSPIRHTIYGKVRGKVTSRYDGVEVEEYLGVPFAEPPEGELRFKRPRNPKPWQGIIETSSIPPACPQMSWYYLQTHTPDFSKSSEDCLYINIFVPKVKKKRLPVLLFVHGGSNRVGMGAMFDGDILSAYGQIVVVNFNYRLGVLGFYADRNEGIEGNNGLLDQVKAMEWVHNNIHFFNGDPSKVTIHGHSAGAGDVGLHLISDLTKGLFRYAIVHSGSPLAYWGVSECVETWRKHMIPDDCEPGSSYITNTKTYEELMLRSIYDKRFLRLDGEKSPYGLVTFRPVKDDHFLKVSPDKLLMCNKVHADSVLLAMARDEGFPFYEKDDTENDDHEFLHSFIPSFGQLFDDDFKEDIWKVYEEWKRNNISRYPHHVQMESDVIFYIPMIKLADLVSKWMDQVYLFSFEYISQNLTGPDWQGVPHGWDLFYVFGAPLVGHPKHNYTSRDIEVAKTTMTLFSNYVKYGILSVDGKERLKTYNSTQKNFSKLDFHDGKPLITSEMNFKKTRVEFWYKYLFPYDPFTCGCDKIQNNSMLYFLCFIWIVYIMY